MKASSSISQKLSLFALSVCSGALVVATGTSAQAIPASSVTPIYVPTFGTQWGDDETQYVLSPPDDTNASVGYRFETTRDHVLVNALGVPAFLNDWAVSNPVTVTLSKKTGSTYQLLSTATFVSDGTFALNPNYTFKDGYYWLEVPVVDLGLKSDTDANVIFETMAQANFENMPYLADGTGTFADVAQYAINAFSFSTDPQYPNAYIDPITDGSGNPLYGFWNPNVSYIVPSPLPIFGAGVAFGYARRMRNRIRLSSGRNSLSVSTSKL